jgi:hypothetical protein
VLRKFMFGLAVLVGTAQVLGATTSCGGDDGKRRVHHAGDKDGDEAREAREEAARQDLAKARKSNTEPAYRLVMKRHEGTAAADEARIGIARLRADEAREALGKGDRKKARALADEAQKTGDPSVAEQARVTLEQIDRSDARHAGKEVKEALEGGQNAESCKKAIDVLAATLGDHPSPVLMRDARKETLQQISSCVQATIDGADKMESFAEARKIIDAAGTKTAVGNDTWHSLSTTFNDKTVTSLVAAVQPDLKANKWESAFATIKKWADAGATGPEQLEVARQQVRDTITSDLLARGKAVLGQAKPEPVLADVDRALKLFEGLNVAPELKTLQTHISAWIECKKLACTVTPKSKMQFTFGATPLQPATSVQSATPVEALPNATKLWVLATGKGKSLVAREDPGDVRTWGERLGAAKGWIDASVLQNDDTSLWLPMGKALEGGRVWLPTGRDDKLYLLGGVESVSGKDVTVKKISDGQTSTLKREDLRTGNMQRGLKVLAFCGDSLSQARFEEFVSMTSGASVARVTCLTADGKDDKLHDVVLGSLRTKPEWLPARKP